MRHPSTLTRLLPWLGFALILIALPYLFPTRTALVLMNAIGVNAVFALSYNMLLGQTGMLSFGHAVYYGLGGYATIHLLAAVKSAGLPIPAPLTPIIGFMGGWAAGALIGWFSCRRAGTPFAMISLGVGELVAAAGLMFKALFGGEEGISGDRTSGPLLFGLQMGAPGRVYWFIAGWLFIAAFAMWAFTKTPLGRLANAVRDNPERVQFVGFDPQRVRYLVFMISGGFAGLAGGMGAVNYEIMTPESLSAFPSAAVLIATFIGGVRLFHGPILGTVFLTLMQSMLSDYTQAWQLYVGGVFVLIVMFAPGGFAGMIHAGRAKLAATGWGGFLPRFLGGAAAKLALGFGAIILIEMIVRWRNGARPLFLFGASLPITSVTAWIITLALLGAGAALKITMQRAAEREAGAAA
ncbi:branched-chain amino acid ABC transporter permease [Terrarubrum flagellatum]|uniref:branched-chain amino acid ABC transporter permease n=1 Tax=Terrirubrum flagellatum TaxID=2895980 RepID=UPI003144F625